MGVNIQEGDLHAHVKLRSEAALMPRHAAVVPHWSQEGIWGGFAGRVFLALDTAVQTTPHGKAEPGDTA